MGSTRLERDTGFEKDIPTGSSDFNLIFAHLGFPVFANLIVESQRSRSQKDFYLTAFARFQTDFGESL